MSDAMPRKSPVRSALALAAILAAALVARVIFLAQLARSETGGVLSLDSRFYYDLARSLSAGGSFPAGAIDFNPLYPAFLVIVFRLFGEGLLAPRIIQLALGIFTVALVYLAGLRLAERPRKAQPSGTVTGLVAAAMAVLYAQFVLYEGMLLSTALEVFLLAASFALTLALEADLAGERPLKLGPAADSGVAFGHRPRSALRRRSPRQTQSLPAPRRGSSRLAVREASRPARRPDPRRRRARRSGDSSRAFDRL